MLIFSTSLKLLFLASAIWLVVVIRQKGRSIIMAKQSGNASYEYEQLAKSAILPVIAIVGFWVLAKLFKNY